MGRRLAQKRFPILEPTTTVDWRLASVLLTSGPSMATLKSEVVSVRVEPPIKAALQAAASREMRSLANMLEVMVIAYCRDKGHPLLGVPAEALADKRSVRARG